MNGLKSLALAFTMYSRVPTPRVDWEGPHQQYVLCFFPAVGWLIGALELLWWRLADLLEVVPLLGGGVALLLPILVTGGIHLDGFCDVCDALASHQSRERMLEILKDSHIGAFAPIGLGVYLVLSLAAWVQLYALDLAWREVAVICLVFPLERACSGLLCVTLPNARGGGLLFHFTQGERKTRVRLLLAAQVLLYLALMALCGPEPAAVAVVFGCLALLWFLGMSRRRFGGVTGDLAGWFLQIFELLILLGQALLGPTLLGGAAPWF